MDNEGEVLDFLVQRRRDAKAARKLMKKLLKKVLAVGVEEVGADRFCATIVPVG